MAPSPVPPLSHADRQTLLAALSDTPQFATVTGRQTLVRNALGGYPLSGQVRKSLGWLDWEGSPLVVADHLVDLLDGQEPAPGIPALGLVAQAIEPLVGAAHQGPLVALRQRMGWGADPAPAPAATWQDERPPGEVVHERIVGEDTLKPIAYLHKALRAADAVVRVAVRQGSGQSVKCGTGFLVAPDLMLTNHHVIRDAAEAAGTEVSFFYEFDIDGRPRDAIIVGTAADRPLAFTDADLDVSLVQLAGAPPLAHYLPLRRALPRRDQRVAIIQHPGGFLKKVSMQNNLVAAANGRIVQYYTSTQGGSSGSPVFDDEFAVVAIHHSAVQDKAWADTSKARPADDPKRVEDLQWRNQGTSTVALIAALEASVPDLLAKLRILD